MCKVSTFVCGLCAGVLAGAVAEAMLQPQGKYRRTSTGKAMQRLGNAMEQALETVSEKLS